MKGRQLFSEVIALLDFDPVCRRLGLDRELLKELASLLQSVGVRWGINQASRVSKGLPEYEAYSWEHGLQRLYDGLIYGEWSPKDCASGLNSAHLQESIGSLTQFLRPVFDLAQRDSEQHSFKDWAELLLSVLRQTLGEGHESGEWMRLLAVEIGELQLHASDVTIRFDTFCTMLEEGDLSTAGPSGLLRRGITFCRLQPARHIPAKVVCILGLDEGSYPRQERGLEFDLIDLQRRHAKALAKTSLRYQEIHYLGDVHIRDADRQLFLDCILNARQRLYLSYVGQSDQNNEDLPPSLLLNELKQFLERVPDPADEKQVAERRLGLARACVRHPLQDWSIHNFEHPTMQLGEPPVPVHFNSQYARIDRQSVSVARFLEPVAVALPEHEHADQLTGEQLLRFLKDPADYYLKQQLHVNLEQLSWLETHEDQEALELDALGHWELRARVFDAWCLAKQQGHVSERFMDELKRRWQLDLTLPLGHGGESVWNRQVLPVLNFLNTLLGDAELRRGRLSLELAAVRFQNTYWETSRGERLVFVHGGLDQAKNLLHAFIQHIGAEHGSLIVNLKECRCESWPSFSECADGLDNSGVEWLSTVVSLWQKGLKAPLAFSLEIGKAYVADSTPANDQVASELLTTAYQKNWIKHTGYGQDCSPAQCLCFDDDSPASPNAAPELREAFAANAECILRPVLDWLEQVNVQKGEQ